MERRKLLTLAGGSMAASVAGCLGGGDDDNGDNGDENGGDNGGANGGDNGNENGGDNGSANGGDNGNENGGDNGGENGGENGDENGGGATQTLDAESTGGIIWIGAETEAEARDQALGFPPNEAVSAPLEIDGEIQGDTWQTTSVEFPNLDISSFVGDEYASLNPSASISAPEGFSGTFDSDEGVMTMEGILSLDFMLNDEEYSVQTEIAATTGESGALTGAFDTESEPMTATLVENEAVIDDETEASIVNGFLELPRTHPMWMELELQIEVV